MGSIPTDGPGHHECLVKTAAMHLHYITETISYTKKFGPKIEGKLVNHFTGIKVNKNVSTHFSVGWKHSTLHGATQRDTERSMMFTI